MSSGVIRYVSDLEPENVMSEFCDVLTAHKFLLVEKDTTDDVNELDPAKSCVCMINQTKIKASIQPPGKGSVSISGYVFVLTSSLTLLEIRKGKGDIFEFHNIHENLIEPSLIESGVIRVTTTVYQS